MIRTAVSLVWLACLSLQAAGTGATLDEIGVLARGGAPGLALILLDRNQPPLDEDDEAWMAYERERLRILAARGDWRRMDTRISGLPEGIPAGFHAWALERQVEARLASDDAQGARALLLALIWRHGAADAPTLRAWRRLVIRSYLETHDLHAALTALQRYTQDYGHDGIGLIALHAEALLAAGRDDDAATLLHDVDDEAVRALRWLAELRAGIVPPADTFEGAVRAGSSSDTPPGLRKAAWRVAAEAARRMDNRAAEIAALERAIVADAGTGILPDQLAVEPRELWAAYREFGRALGNDMQLIVGIDGPWFDAAEASDEGLKKRALYAALSADTRTGAVAANAQFRFARSLQSEAGGERLLVALYLDAGEFPEPEAIPPSVRQALIDPVLGAGDIALASRLIADLESPPSGTDVTEWALRRARVLVLGGRIEGGVRVLHALLDEPEGIEIDRLLQVLFDLQAVDAHEHALELFARMHAIEGLPRRTHRELLYWMADSWHELGQHEEAARMYLRSATLNDPYAMDPWAQTARYQAAGSLAEAGLHEDAITSLRTLLNATDDTARQAVLRHRIDQLRRFTTGRDR